LEPAYAGCFPDDGYVHDAECVIYHGPDARYQGQEICFCYNEDTLTLVDVTEKHAPILLSKRGYSHAMYTHQGWLTEDQSTILLDDELDEAYDVSPDSDKLGHTITYLWDVSDLLSPVLKNYYISTEVAIDHNQYILGDFTYQSNYGAGLRILHIDQANYDLKEVAYFDCLPTAAKSAEFEGTWSNYPYFKSGNIIVSSIEYGLYVVRPDYEAMESAAKPNMSYMEQRRERGIDFAKAGAVCPGLVESRVCGMAHQNEENPSQ
jgi:choice-of-anchor B domain-containing protein